MKYIGEELENFSIATFWRKYTLSKVDKFLKDKKVLEVGAGTGSFSELIINKCESLTILEPDDNFFEFLKKKFYGYKNVKVVHGTIDNLNEKYDAIIHFQVLEHIKDDNSEILKNLSLLKNCGYLLICVPSFMSLYSKFDKSIGHYKRYIKKDFLEFNLGNSKIKKMFYIDSVGYFIYRLFKIFIDSEKPNKFMIFIWDKFFIPVSYLFDKLIFYKIGKNLIVIIKKSEI